MPVQKPLQYGIDKYLLLASQSLQALHDLIHKRPQVTRHAT